MTSSANAPIGVFDSGVGGLSVLRHIRAQLPREHLLYFADSAFAPYGDKPEHTVAERSLAIAGFLVEQGAKALVVACNTATVAAIRLLRAHYPDMPIVGVEPGLKPGAAASRNGIVGVLATDGTLAGEKFQLLLEQIGDSSKAKFLLQACTGLADQIELGELDSDATAAMLARYITPLLDQGADTLVLGCTHYPLVQATIEHLIAKSTARHRAGRYRPSGGAPTDPDARRRRQRPAGRRPAGPSGRPPHWPHHGLHQRQRDGLAVGFFRPAGADGAGA